MNHRYPCAPRRTPAVLMATLLGLLLAPQARAAVERTGKQIYESACASCHGQDGRGAARERVGFATPLPDFSDCSFSTREPNADWVAVGSDGGPARAFDRLMPAFGDSLSEAEIEKALEHVRSFCRELPSWPRGDLNMPRALVTEKAFPEDEAVITTAVATEQPQAVTNKLVFETRVLARGQVELIVPFAFVESEETGNWRGGIGDVGLGTKWAVLHSLGWGSILSLAGEVVLPTGNQDKGFGKGVTFVEPFVSFGQLLGTHAFLQAQAGAGISTEPDEAAHELFWRGVLGFSLQQGRFGRTWSPMVEVLGARELEDDQVVEWDVVPQLQVTLPTRQHIMACAGVRLPLNDFAKRQTQVLIYLLWDWFDGGLFEGW